MHYQTFSNFLIFLKTFSNIIKHSQSFSGFLKLFFRTLEPKRNSVDNANEDPKPTTSTPPIQVSVPIPAIPKPPEDPRCKVCFKQIGDSEYFRVCSGCVRRVCEDCSASYTSKDEPEVRHLSFL